MLNRIETSGAAWPQGMTRRWMLGQASLSGLSLTLAACGAGSAPATPVIGQKEVSLQFMYAGEPTVPEGHKAMVAPFEQRYPRIKIEHVHTPAQYVDKIVSLMVAGTPPDVFWGGGSDMIDFADRSMPLPLKVLMKRDRLDTFDLYLASVAHYEWKGEQDDMLRDCEKGM